MNADKTITVSASTIDELKKMIEDLVAQGWNSDSKPVDNGDGTYSVTLSRV